ncbi:estrogen receptor beta-like [Notothenia coriiceps]|uniref:Estrogen receptor beta-like n=1 Tax=Notothenia coriiceps TaxID=8208 RepID=A0A6I9Q529_9TELE|nr:PREDICTED: estrogen receptor beta-like [Notothenia coriiceps]
MMAAALFQEKEHSLLQLQEVDSSRVGCRALPPPLRASSPGLSMENQPICIPSPYTDIGHDFPPLPFYSPTIFTYAGPGISDCPSVRQSLSPSLFWPSHSHVGPLPLHQAQARPPQPVHSPWVELRDGVLMARYCETLLQVFVYAQLPLLVLHHSLVSERHNDYICPATNQCTIDKNRRKSCQACRLRKCCEVGMTKCGLRKERANCRNPQTRRVTRLSSESRTNLPKALNGPVVVLSNAPLPPALTPEHLISRIMEAEPPEIYLMKDMNRPLTEANVMMSLTNLADKELVHMISWAKKIPGGCGGARRL